MVISAEYRDINRALHESKKSYGRSGKKWAHYMMHLQGSSILDYGCGKGSLANVLPFKISEYDPAIPGKDSPPEPHDVIVCTDVMEHIEPDCLDSVLAHIRSLMKREGFFVIATRPAKKCLPDGRNAHLIIEPWEWWAAKLREHFRIVEFAVDPIESGEVAVWVE